MIAADDWGRTKGYGPTGRTLRAEMVIHTEAGARIPEDVPSTPVYEGWNLAQEHQRMRAIESLHTRPVAQGGRGWSAIAYTFVVFPSGRAYVGRGWGRDGSHTQQGRNYTAYAICYAGHGDRYPASEAAWQTAAALIREGLASGYLSPLYVVSGHRDYAPKSCPGNLIYPRIGRLRGLALPTEENDDMSHIAYAGPHAYHVSGVHAVHIVADTLAELKLRGLKEVTWDDAEAFLDAHMISFGGGLPSPVVVEP